MNILYLISNKLYIYDGIKNKRFKKYFRAINFNEIFKINKRLLNKNNILKY